MPAAPLRGTRGGPWRRTAPGPEGTATPSAGLVTAPALCFRRPDGDTVGCAGIAVARPETTSLSMSCGTRVQGTRPGDPDGVGSSVLPSVINCLPNGGLRTTGTAYCSAACDSATLRQPAPSPVLRLLWLGTPLPDLPVRAPAADAFTEVPLTHFTAGYREPHLRVLPLLQLRYCSWRPLITAGHPVRSSVPSPSCDKPGFETPPPNRPAHCNCGTAARQFVSAGPFGPSGYERNHSRATAQCLLRRQ